MYIGYSLNRTFRPVEVYDVNRGLDTGNRFSLTISAVKRLVRLLIIERSD